MEVGDKVLVIAKGKPYTGKLVRVTPSGKTRVVSVNGGELRFGERGRVEGQKYGEFSGAECYDWSASMYNEAEKRHQRGVEDMKEEISRRNLRQLEVYAEQHRRIAEFKVLCGGELPAKAINVPGAMRRLYVVHVPCNPKNTDIRGSFSVAIVHCDTETDWKAEPTGKVITGYASITQKSCSFAISSGYEHDSDEEALWDLATKLYGERW